MLRPTLLLAMLLTATLTGSSTNDSARLVASRAGSTAAGTLRILFETDRPVDFLTVELPFENGFEVHLLNVEGSDLPATLRIQDSLVSTVSFRPTPTGIVAKILGSSTRLSAKCFPLERPNRVVVDVIVAPEDDVEPPGPDDPPRFGISMADPAVAAKGAASDEAADDDRAPAEIDALVLGEEVDNPSPSVGGADSTVSSFGRPGSSYARAGRDRALDPRFKDVSAWLEGLAAAVDALGFSETEEDRVRHRRHLAYLLEQRSILNEAESTLQSAIDTPYRDTATAVADSVKLAEIRVRLSRFDRAGDLAREVDAARATDDERVRLAQVMLAAGNPEGARSLVYGLAYQDNTAVGARATLVLARSHWDLGEIREARDRIRSITSHGELDADIAADVLLLHADCEFALKRSLEAQALYARASSLALTNAQAAWIGLQLGNLARQDGRYAEARAHWRRTMERWPDTYYASQAAWLLRFEERMHELSQLERRTDRG
jgi:tetratricopeptide (TPR) repeat protein